MDPLPIPLLVLAAFFVVLAFAQWSRLAVCARVSLGGAAVFALAGLEYPGESVNAVLGHTDDGLVYLVAIAAGACSAVTMITAISLMRSLD